MSDRLNPLEDLGDLFVNRDKELEKFWKWATGVPHPGRNSYAFVGLRRMGKTAILHKLFNRLFYEQEAVLPIYISFAEYLYREEPITVYEFAEKFFGGYIRSYLAFRYQRADFHRWNFDFSRLLKEAHKMQDEFAIEWIEHYREVYIETMGAQTASTPYGLVQWLINFPMGAARIKNMPTAMIIDEFQVLTKVYNPKSERYYDLTNGFQKASETKWAPLLVSGSAVSLLVEDALGGMLSGRFKTHILKPLSHVHTHDLVFRLGAEYGITVNEEFAEAVWLLTEGYPYSIDSLMTSDSPQVALYPDLSALTEAYLFELTDPQGQLWTHYSREFGKYSHELNEGLTTRRVMLWATKYPGERIDADRIADKLEIEVSQVRASLEKLHWVDVVRKIGLISYQGPSDPVMRRYIEYQHLVEIDKLAPAVARKNWYKEYKSLEGEVNRHKGAMAEVHVGAVMGRFDGRDVDGTVYFNHPERVTLPKFDKIQSRRGIVKDGIAIEIDLIGLYSSVIKAPTDGLANDQAGQEEVKSQEALEGDTSTELAQQYNSEALGSESSAESSTKTSAWLVQVRYTKDPMGSPEIRKFLKQVEAVTTEKKYISYLGWYVCKGGFRKPARKLLEEAGVLFSDREQFNKLANQFGFFGLPA